MPLMTGNLSIYYTRDNKKSHVNWTVMSLDMMLGIIGGLSVLVWGLFRIVFSGYETFKLENSLISAVYPTAPLGRPDIDGDDFKDEWTPKDDKEAKKSLMRRVAQRGIYFYNYSDYLFSWCCRCMFCLKCCRKCVAIDHRISKLERH